MTPDDSQHDTGAPPPQTVLVLGATGQTGGPQEVKNGEHAVSQEKFHRGVLKGVRNISDTLSDNGMKFLL